MDADPAEQRRLVENVEAALRGLSPMELAAAKAGVTPDELRALVKAGISDYVRPFHDLRHTAITNDAASGASPIAVMTKAGHSDMKTTQRYMHMAGVLFRDEAEANERRLLGGVSSTDSSTDLTSPEGISGNGNARSDAASHAAG